MKKQKKTNAARILDNLGISYEIKEYKVDLENLSATHVAKETGMPIEKVFMTLVARGDKTGVIMAVIPGTMELDLKTLATVSDNKRVEMVHLKDVQMLTGYIRGGCSPLGPKKNTPFFGFPREKKEYYSDKRGNTRRTASTFALRLSKSNSRRYRKYRAIKQAGLKILTGSFCKIINL